MWTDSTLLRFHTWRALYRSLHWIWFPPDRHKSSSPRHKFFHLDKLYKRTHSTLIRVGIYINFNHWEIDLWGIVSCTMSHPSSTLPHNLHMCYQRKRMFPQDNIYSIFLNGCRGSQHNQNRENLKRTYTDRIDILWGVYLHQEQKRIWFPSIKCWKLFPALCEGW